MVIWNPDPDDDPDGLTRRYDFGVARTGLSLPYIIFRMDAPGEGCWIVNGDNMTELQHTYLKYFQP